MGRRYSGDYLAAAVRAMSEGKMSEQSIDDVLNGTPIAEQAQPETPEAESTEAAERQRDEQGRFVAKGEDEQAPPIEAAPAEAAPPAAETVPLKALQEERGKRQTLEQQLAEVSQRLQRIEQPPQEPQEMPDPWVDPQGHAQWLADNAGQVAEQRAFQAAQRHHVMVSAEAAKLKHPDYMEKVAVFEQLAAANPALSQAMLHNPDPAEFAYQVVQQHERVGQYGSIDKLLEAEKAKWEAEALDKLKATLNPAQVPPTLAGERNVGSRTGPEWAGPKSLSDILN